MAAIGIVPPTHGNAGLLALQQKLATRALTAPPSPGQVGAADLLSATDGIAVEFTPGLADTAEQAARTAILSHLPGWALREEKLPQVGYNGVTALPPPDAVPEIAAAWEFAQQLSQIPGVYSAVPLFAQVALAAEREDGLRELAPPDGAPIPAAGDDWPLHALHVREAWAALGRKEIGPGQAVRVAVLDTGYTRHPEIWERLTKLPADPQRVAGIDIIDGDDDPLDLLEGAPPLGFPSHGTGVTSVIVSPPGAQGDWGPGNYVDGIAPGAQVVPVRTTTNVVLLVPNTLMAALVAVAAPDQQIDVANISLGHPFGWPALHAAVRQATQAGVIVVAAAGNFWPFVVYPAGFPEVVAAAACGPDLQPWQWSASGPAVDVLTPGMAVPRALTHAVPGAPEPTYSVSRGQGTTYAAASCAGLAALWLAAHGGRQALIEHYGGDAARVPQAFHYLLQATAHLPPGVARDRYGAGFPDAAKLIAADLPPVADLDQAVQARALAVAPAADSAITADFPLAYVLSRPAGAAAGPRTLGGAPAAAEVPDVLLRELHFQIASRPALWPLLDETGAGGSPAALRARLLETGQLSPRLAAYLQGLPD